MRCPVIVFVLVSSPVHSGLTIIAADSMGQTVDLRMLRSFRVLRPLKLVSRLPSKCSNGAPELLGVLVLAGMLALATWSSAR